MKIRPLFLALIVLLAFAAGGAVALRLWGKTTKEEVVRAYHEYFYYGQTTWAKSYWLGIPTFQNPNDVWITQEIIVEQKPDLIIEAGSANGGSALLWAMIQREVNPEGRVITLDIDDLTADARKQPIWQERIEQIIASSTDAGVFAKLKERAAGKRVLVLLDSDHRRDHVLQELKLYSQLIQPGGYILVQDTDVSGHPIVWEHGPGPMEAVEEFLKENPNFSSDLSRERFLFTMHPRGYLRRNS